MNSLSMRMPPRTAFALAIVAALSMMTVACNRQENQEPATGSNQSAAGAATPSAAPANTASPPTNVPATPQLAAADRDFVSSAASGGALEVEASKLALDRSKNEGLNKFAQRMVDDHSKLGEELRTVATANGYGDLSTSLNSDHAAQLEKLRALQGREFDREYAAQIGVAAHEEAIAVFERGARDVGNGPIRSFADGHLAELREHQTLAQSLAKNVGVSSARLAVAAKAGDAVRNSSAAIAPDAMAGSTTTQPISAPGAGSSSAEYANSSSSSSPGAAPSSPGKNSYEAAPGANSNSGREATPHTGQMTPPGAFGGPTGDPSGSGPGNSKADGATKK